MAPIAASTMLSGVAKSGSPISRWTTRLPSASSFRARARTSNAPSVPRRDMRSAKRIAVLATNRIVGPWRKWLHLPSIAKAWRRNCIQLRGRLSRRVHVPVGHVLEALERLDRLVEVHPVHALGDRVLVPPRVEEDRRRRVRHQCLEIDVGGQSGLRVEGVAAVLEVLVDQTPAARIGEVERPRVYARMPQ